MSGVTESGRPENPLPLRFWSNEERDALQAELVAQIKAERALVADLEPDPAPVEHWPPLKLVK